MKNILAIETSCDETAAAIVCGRRIIANKIYSQILLHRKWGGVVPSLAKKAHEEKIDYVVEEVLKKIAKNPKSPFSAFKKIDAIAVTYGPGLAIALEVGIKKAKELAEKFNKPLIGVNHLEGHIYSCFAQNRRGNPKREFNFPYLVLIVSGGHTELVLFKNHLDYQVLGKTIDDAAGEALDKAAKMLGLGYPGGPVIERLAEKGDPNFYYFPRPLLSKKNLDFSFSGLKTAFYYFLKKKPESFRLNNLNHLASSFQQAVFDVLLKKLELGVEFTKIKNILVVGGVAANQKLRKEVFKLTKKIKGKVFFPPFKTLYGDNAAMIGIAGYYRLYFGFFLKNKQKLDRVPRLQLGDDSLYFSQP